MLHNYLLTNEDRSNPITMSKINYLTIKAFNDDKGVGAYRGKLV